jgi:hypothetical protein
MASKPRLTSCESLEGLTDISQTQIPRVMSGDEGAGPEGRGEHIGAEIMGSSIITYLIKEGDWNIEDPLGRILGTNLCLHYGNQPHVYGSYETKFKNFWVDWVGYYRTKILKQDELEFDEETFKKSPDELVKILKRFGRDGTRKIKYLLRGIINNSRFDVLDIIFNSNDHYIESMKMWTLKLLDSMFQPKVFKTFPSETQKPIKEIIDKELIKVKQDLKNSYELITGKMTNEQLENVREYVSRVPVENQLNVYIHIFNGFGREIGDIIEYPNLANAFNNEEFQIVKNILDTINKSDLETELKRNNLI